MSVTAVASLPATQVHANLLGALETLQRAEGNALIWFSEILNRQLYRNLGFASMWEYALQELGFSKSKTGYFLRLARSMNSLPLLRESLEKGNTTWTKAREVVTVATTKTDKAWTALAQTSSQRQLKTAVKRAKQEVRLRGTADVQPSLELIGESATELAYADPSVTLGRTISPRRPGQNQAAPIVSDQGRADSCPPAKATIAIELEAEQLARFEALVEALRKTGLRTSRDDLVLAGLEALLQEQIDRKSTRVESETGQSKPKGVESGTGSGKPKSMPSDSSRKKSTRVESNRDCRKSTRVECREQCKGGCRRINRSPYQVSAHYCPKCEKGTISTNRGVQPIPGSVLRAILCDSHILNAKGRNTSTIPPAMRRKVLARDACRCRTQGCNNAHFLEVHHVVPKMAGGPHGLDNLITLCSACHRWLHRSS